MGPSFLMSVPKKEKIGLFCEKYCVGVPSLLQ